MMEKPLQQVSQEQQAEWHRIADELETLQGEQNDGRGVSCVRSVVHYLRVGDIASARQVCLTDGDKMRNYPVIKDYIKERMFDAADHPWAYEDRE